jgi:putative SOS response-associated peptidase YedK
MRDLTGNLPPMPGVFPDYPAPIVRNGPDGVRELMLARWGMPGPPQFGGAPITNIRNTASPHWRVTRERMNMGFVAGNCLTKCGLFFRTAPSPWKSQENWKVNGTRPALGRSSQT